MILVCDDDQYFAEKLIEVLKELTEQEVEYHQSCHSAMQCLERFRKEEIYPDLMFMDFNMPKQDGYECVKKIRNNFPPFPVVLMSADIDQEVLGKFYRTCIRSFMPKTHNRKDIVNYVTAANLIWLGEHKPVFPKRNKKPFDGEERRGMANPCNDPGYSR